MSSAKMSATTVSVVFLLLSFCCSITLCQLVVNVKNKGEEVIVESIHANTTSDTVTLEYLNTDGTLVTLFIDFKSVSISQIQTEHINPHPYPSPLSLSYFYCVLVLDGTRGIIYH